MTFDSTGCFHWCSSRAIEECTMTRQEVIVELIMMMMMMITVVATCFNYRCYNVPGNGDYVLRAHHCCNICRGKQPTLGPQVSIRNAILKDKKSTFMGRQQIHFWNTRNPLQEPDDAVEGFQYQL